MGEDGSVYEFSGKLQRVLLLSRNTLDEKRVFFDRAQPLILRLVVPQPNGTLHDGVDHDCFAWGFCSRPGPKGPKHSRICPESG